jgi:hypothetical protein
MQAIKVPSSARALSQLSARQAITASTSTALKTTVEAAKAECAHLSDFWVQLEIEAIRCKSFNFDGLVAEKTNEVYVVGWMVDGSGRADGRTTQVFNGYRKNDLITLETNGVGVPVARIRNPVRYVHWGFAVMESDEKARTVAADIQTALADHNVVDALASVAKALAGAYGSVISAVETASTALGGLLLDRLEDNKDDTMIVKEGGGLDLQFFNAHEPGDAENTENTFARVRFAVHLYHS